MTAMIIALDGWAAGERKFRFKAGLEFFQMFDNQEILDACVDVQALVLKDGHRLHVQTEIAGTVTVQCDRCLEDLVLEVRANPSFVAEEGAEEGAVTEDGTEVIPLDREREQLDLSQAVYDYVCISLPLHKVHPEGECNSEALRFLDNSRGEAPVADDSPFAALKGLFEEK